MRGKGTKFFSLSQTVRIYGTIIVGFYCFRRHVEGGGIIGEAIRGVTGGGHSSRTVDVSKADAVVVSTTR